MRKLTVDDIVDMRAYERERHEFRSRVIAAKKLHHGKPDWVGTAR